MTANELADKLQELDSKLHLIELFKSATMLRQQAKEIEELKEDLKNKNINIEYLKVELEDCTCQGGHSEAYLKVKDRL